MSVVVPESKKRAVHITLPVIAEKHRMKIPISMITAYDYATAKAAHESGVDMILVGDSLGMVVLGHSSTVPVTMDDMLSHAAAVSRTQATRKAFIVGDLPFGSYATNDVAIANACRMMQEGGVDAIKLEGGRTMSSRIRALVDNGIPVMGHIGLTPQTFSSLGGYRVQGRTAESALKLLDDAIALQEAGCFAMVLETVPKDIADHITRCLKIPTIGIGAGNGTSGQVLVAHDMLGMFEALQPKFVKKFANLGPQMQLAIKSYHEEVVQRTFPAPEHSFTIPDDQLQAYLEKAKPILTARGIKPSATVPVTDAKKAESTAASKPSHPPTLWFKRSATAFVTPSFPIKKVAVIGGGAMGTLAAAALSSPSLCDVTLISDWPEHVKAINSFGLQLAINETQLEPVFMPAITVAAAPVHFSRAKADLAIILVKAGQMARAIELVYDVVRPGGAVLTLQNGMGYQDQLLNLSHQYHLMRGITFSGASVPVPGALQVNGRGQTVLAPFNPASYESDFQSSSTFNFNDLDVCNSIASLFNHAGMDTLSFPDSNSVFEKILWEKVAVNSVINPLSAIFNVRNGELLQHPVARQIIPLLLEEICNVFQNGLLLDISRTSVTQRVIQSIQQTANNVSSMLADVRRQVPTEIEYMNGQIVKHGLENNIDVPMNAVIVDTIREIEESFTTPKRSPLTMGSLDAKTRDLVLEMRNSAFAQPFARKSHAYSTLAAHPTKPRAYSTNARATPFVAPDIQTFRSFRKSIGLETSLGFVPTMGALHTGHLSLVEAAKKQCEKVAVSIFVNPTQFGPNEDFNAYPRTLESDLALLASVGVDVVFAPKDASVMYPPSLAPSLSVLVPDAHLKKEGVVRPFHFNGVATVCLKLFNVVQPTAVFFGQKDAQQCSTIKSLVKDFNLPIEVCICPTMRAPDGLALSSRNAYLNQEERAASVILFQTLSDIERLYRNGERDAEVLRQLGMKMLTSQKLSVPQYVSISDLDTMVEIPTIISQSQVQAGLCVSLASKVGNVRLIDNFAILP